MGSNVIDAQRDKFILANMPQHNSHHFSDSFPDSSYTRDFSFQTAVPTSVQVCTSSTVINGAGAPPGAPPTDPWHHPFESRRSHFRHGSLGEKVKDHSSRFAATFFPHIPTTCTSYLSDKTLTDNGLVLSFAACGYTSTNTIIATPRFSVHARFPVQHHQG